MGHPLTHLMNSKKALKPTIDLQPQPTVAGRSHDHGIVRLSHFIYSIVIFYEVFQSIFNI